MDDFNPGPEVRKLFSCLAQLSMKFQVLLKTKLLKNKKIISFVKHTDVVFIQFINVEMPTIVGILTFMDRMNLLLS